MLTTRASNTLQGHFLRAMMMALLIVGAIIATAPMAAACGSPSQTQAGVFSHFPMLPPAPGGKTADSHQGMVGLWHVYYTDSSGNPFYEAYDMWHADGTEWESSFGDPRTGNYCFGVWTQVGARTVQLRHFAWVYNADGTPAGSFILTETDTINRKGNAYTGTFDYKQYDVNGNFQWEITGTQAATRF